MVFKMSFQDFPFKFCFYGNIFSQLAISMSLIILLPAFTHYLLFFLTSTHYFFLCSILPNFWFQCLKNLAHLHINDFNINICNHRHMLHLVQIFLHFLLQILINEMFIATFYSAPIQSNWFNSLYI